jgi:hypothetical protein
MVDNSAGSGSSPASLPSISADRVDWLFMTVWSAGLGYWFWLGLDRSASAVGGDGGGGD